MARPRLPKTDKKQKMTVRLHPAIRKEAVKAAKKEGMSASEYIERAVKAYQDSSIAQVA